MEKPMRFERTTEEVSQFLWSLHDDIDTASDMAKGDDHGYRELVEKIQRRRFEVGSTDGYRVSFTEDISETPPSLEPPHDPA